jgi:hypothetical protein
MHMQVPQTMQGASDRFLRYLQGMPHIPKWDTVDDLNTLQRMLQKLIYF